jgi:hypothetical protein
MKRANKAVSETVGTLLLLGMSITLFSVIYLSVMTIYPTSANPSINLICSKDGNNITIEHRGGKSLDLDTKILLNIDGNNIPSKTVSQIDFIDINGDGFWSIGEKVVYNEDITNKNVTVSVIDTRINSVIMMLNFQD